MTIMRLAESAEVSLRIPVETDGKRNFFLQEKITSQLPTNCAEIQKPNMVITMLIKSAPRILLLHVLIVHAWCMVPCDILLKVRRI